MFGMYVGCQPLSPTTQSVLAFTPSFSSASSYALTRWQPPVGRSRHPPSWGRTPAPPPLWEPTPGRGAATLNAAVKLSIPAKGRYHGQTHACRSGLACDAGRLHAGRPTDPTSAVIDPRGQRNPDSLSIPAAAQLDAGLNTFTHARPLRSTRAPPFSKWSLDRSPQPRCW